MQVRVITARSALVDDRDRVKVLHRQRSGDRRVGDALLGAGDDDRIAVQRAAHKVEVVDVDGLSVSQRRDHVLGLDIHRALQQERTRIRVVCVDGLVCRRGERDGQRCLVPGYIIVHCLSQEAHRRIGAVVLLHGYGVHGQLLGHRVLALFGDNVLILVRIDGEYDRLGGRVLRVCERGLLCRLVPGDREAHRICDRAQRGHGAVIFVLVRRAHVSVEHDVPGSAGLVLYADRYASRLGIRRQRGNRANACQHGDRQNAGYDLLDLHSFILLIFWDNCPFVFYYKSNALFPQSFFTIFTHFLSFSDWSDNKILYFYGNFHTFYGSPIPLLFRRCKAPVGRVRRTGAPLFLGIFPALWAELIQPSPLDGW